MRARAGRLVRIIPALAVGATALMFAAPGASAASGTAGTFTVTGGGLAINPPATASLGSVAAGVTTLSGQLGSVTVNDTRGALVANWTATVVSTDFTTGTSPVADQTVTAANINYSAGTATTTGTGVFAGVPTVGGIATAVTAATWTGAIGNNTATWNPTITFTLSASQVAGVYNGTITHSVS